MAKTAKKESEEQAEIVKPDFEKALKIIDQDIIPNEEAMATRRGQLSGPWKAIQDDCHVNKAAARLIVKLKKMSPETRDDFLRSQYGLMKAADLGITHDLVDQANGVRETMPVRGSGFSASDAEWDAAGQKQAEGITGDSLPPELQKLADEGKAPAHVPDAAGLGDALPRRRAGKKPELVTVN